MTLDRTIAPAIHDAVEFDYKLPPIQSGLLDNGIPFHSLDAGVQEVLETDWVFPAGVWYEPANGVAHAVAALLKSGTATRTAAEINEALEFYGAELRTGAQNDFAVVTLYCLSKHLGALLPVVYDILTACTFPEYEVELYKTNSIQRLSVNMRKCEFVANREIDAALFGKEHPYGRCTEEASLVALNGADIASFYKAHYNPAHAQIFMAGKVGADALALVNEVFGKNTLIFQPLPPIAFQPAPGEERVVHIMNDAAGVQGAVRIGRPFPNRHHPDYTPMVVLNTVFGGYFGSRLMSNIREDKGFTYGIYSGISPERNGGSMVIQTETGRDVVSDAVREVYIEMDRLCNEPVSEDELLLVKNYLLGGLLGDLDGPFSILRRWRSLILDGFDESRFNNSVRIYKSVTPNELQMLARRYFRKEEFYEIVVI